MEAQVSPLSRRAAALACWLLPPRCLLCGDAGMPGADLCAACAAELPRNHSCCARCALPLPAPAALCGACQRRVPAWDAAWAPFRYAWPLDRLEARYKFAADLAAGRTLGELWLREPRPAAMPQLLIPVPLHRSRLRERGYNQALELAKVLSRGLGVPLRHDALVRLRATGAQTELDAVGRRRNVRGAFALGAGVALPLPGHVAVVDDVMTTGATVGECAKVLRGAGVSRVDVWVVGRAPAPRG
jgi:ComF family protein